MRKNADSFVLLIAFSLFQQLASIPYIFHFLSHTTFVLFLVFQLFFQFGQTFLPFHLCKKLYIIFIVPSSNHQKTSCSFLFFFPSRKMGANICRCLCVEKSECEDIAARSHNVTLTCHQKRYNQIIVRKNIFLLPLFSFHLSMI